jgi:hypothetical protein
VCFFSLGVENRGEGTLDEADQAYQLSAIGISHVSVDLSIFLVLLYFSIYFLIIKREFFDFMFSTWLYPLPLRFHCVGG